MALLRPGRCCSRRQGGCLQHRTEAQRRPKGQDAGGTPALPGNAVPAVRWGVSGGVLLRKPTCALWETPVCPRSWAESCLAVFGRAMRSGRVHLNRRVRGCGSTGITRPRAPARDSSLAASPACADDCLLPGDKGSAGKAHQEFRTVLGQVEHVAQCGTNIFPVPGRPKTACITAVIPACMGAGLLSSKGTGCSL